MPVGYLVSVGLVAVCTYVAVRPPMPARSSPSSWTFWLGFLVNELPFVAAYWLVGATLLAAAQGDLGTPLGLLGLVVAAAAVPGLVLITRRALAAPVALDAAVAGVGGRINADDRPWWRALLWPFPTRPHGVERFANLSYGDAGRAHLLDVYRPRGRPPDGPTLVHLHGGAFHSGGKSREARPLLHRLARHGWVCVSANYRLAPNGSYLDQLEDAKRVIAWVREHGHHFGADLDRLFVAGSSAGAHLASTAASTAGRPRLAAGVRGRGHVGHGRRRALRLLRLRWTPVMRGPPRTRTSMPTRRRSSSSTATWTRSRWSRTPATFVGHLRAESAQPVVYAELPGAQHDFDLFHSLRFEAVGDAVEQFAAAVTYAPTPSPGGRR